MYEIARGYNVDWTPEPPASSADSEDKPEGGDDEPGGGIAVKTAERDGEGDANGDEEGKNGTQDEEAEAVVVPAKSSTTYPAGTEKDAWADKPTAKDTPVSSGPPTKKLSPEEELAQRFERLKKL